MRLNQFDYFRAVAIIIIVAGHVCMSEMLPNSSLPEKMFVSLMTGGTALFVFISGFFFHHVFYQKFDYAKFMTKKFKNVFIPYALITSGFFFCYLLLQNLTGVNLQSTGVNTTQTTNGFDICYSYLTTLIYGKISGPYWYIPFIMVVFALSPIFLSYIKLSATIRFAINAALLVISMFLFRAADNTFIFHNTLYFMPIYCLGINYSIHKSDIDSLIRNKTFLLLSCVLALTYYQVEVLGETGYFLKSDWFSYQGVDIFIMQKILLCFLLLSFFQKIEEREISILKVIASASFAIFFIHPFVIRMFEKTQLIETLSYQPPYLALFLLLITTITAFSVGIAMATKAIFKSKSKYIIGW